MGGNSTAKSSKYPPGQHPGGTSGPYAPDEREERREQVRYLYVSGYGPWEIHRTLKARYPGIALNTIIKDVDAVRRQHMLERPLDVEQAYADSVAFYQRVKQEAMHASAKAPDNANNKVQALSVAVQAQQRIDELTGVNAPERLTAAAAATFQAAVMEVLLERDDPRLLQEVAARIAARTGGTSVGRLLPGASSVANQPSQVGEVEADGVSIAYDDEDEGDEVDATNDEETREDSNNGEIRADETAASGDNETESDLPVT